MSKQKSALQTSKTNQPKANSTTPKKPEPNPSYPSKEKRGESGRGRGNMPKLKIKPEDNAANMQNKNKGTSGQNKQFVQNQENINKQKPIKK